MTDIEKIDYLNGMKEYLKNLKAMPKRLAKREARQSLIRAGILTKRGRFTAHYRKGIESDG